MFNAFSEFSLIFFLLSSQMKKKKNSRGKKLGVEHIHLIKIAIKQFVVVNNK